MKSLIDICIPRDTVNDEEVLIVSVPCDDGDYVRKGETVLEYETSKAVKSIEIQEEGYIAYRCKVMENVKVGSAVAAIFSSRDDHAVAEWRANIPFLPPAYKRTNLIRQE